MNKKVLFWILLILTIASIIFVNNDYFVYKSTIIKIDTIETEELVENYNQLTKEKYYLQKIKGTIKNGKYKNNTISFENNYTTSEISDDKLNNNSEVFAELSQDGKSIISITGIKRDKYLIILIDIFILSILLIGSKKGLFTIISLILNIIISFLSIFIYKKMNLKVNIFLIFSIASILFITLSLLITNGKNKKSKAAIISSIFSLIISFIISFVVLSIYDNSIPYWYMPYVEVLNDYKGFFFINILLNGLGAIMDISITMASSLSELIRKNNKISYEELKKSGKEISSDVLGTMSNVILFTTYASTIPFILLALKNKVLIKDAVEIFGQIDMIYILTSCISIVIAIPISLYVSLHILKGGKKKCI